MAPFSTPLLLERDRRTPIPDPSNDQRDELACAAVGLALPLRIHLRVVFKHAFKHITSLSPCTPGVSGGNVGLMPRPRLCPGQVLQVEL